MFLIYINDLPQVFKASVYADGTSLSFQYRDISRLNETVNDDLKSLALWMQGNKPFFVKCVENSIDAYLHQT